MAHTSLYRKYRPATFDDVVGQQHIERTLRNAADEGSVAHAYLFTGPRGTGKTTTARLLAKALLCERGPTSEPDATCEQCTDIAAGRHPDVREIDAASNTGVDAIREEIIGRVQFSPSRGRYKVYIIDEVHMLSSAAFNALLKTLEEPPSHVVFVLCTTHPQKVPETIQSRCQRFDFRRLSVEDIADRLRYISEAEGITVDRGAVNLIARHAEGGMRDAITALEQIAAFTGNEVTADDVEGMFGEVDTAQLFEIAGIIARRDIAGGFTWVASAVETGTELAEMVRELTGHVRDLFIVASVDDVTGVVDRPAEDLSRLASQAKEFGGPDRLAYVLDLLGELSAEMRWSSDPRLSLEVALTRMARPQGEMTLEALAERVEAIERGGGGAGAVPPLGQDRGVATQGAGDHAAHNVLAGDPAPACQNPVQGASPAASDSAGQEAEVKGGEQVKVKGEEQGQVKGGEQVKVKGGGPEAAGVSAAGKLDRAAVKRSWQAVLAEIKKVKATRVQTFSNVEIDVDPDGETLVVEFASDQSFSMEMAEEPDNRALLKQALAAVFGTAPPFRYQLGRGAVRPAERRPYEAPAADETPAAVVETQEQVTGEPPVGDPGPVWPEPERPVPADTPADAQAADVEPDAPVAEVTSPASALERLLVEDLGARIVGESRPETDEGTDA